MEAIQYKVESEWSREHGSCLPLAVMLVKPENKPVGLVQLVHGIRDHKEKYLPLMEYLANRGYASIIHDQRGHGESILSEEDLGYFYTDDANALIEDIHQITGELRKVDADAPIYLFGHSMGSMAVRAYAKKYDQEIEGLFVCGCPTENPMAKAAEMLVRSIALIKGDKYRSRYIAQLAFADYCKRFPEETEHAWISSDPERVKEYDADPLCNFIPTLNGFRNLFQLMQMAYDTTGWKTEKSDMPVHFISGSNDPCLGDQEKYEKAIEKMHDAGYRRVNGRLYGGLRHEILLEKCAAEIYEDIVDRMDEWRSGK